MRVVKGLEPLDLVGSIDRKATRLPASLLAVLSIAMNVFARRSAQARALLRTVLTPPSRPFLNPPRAEPVSLAIVVDCSWGNPRGP